MVPELALGYLFTGSTHILSDSLILIKNLTHTEQKYIEYKLKKSLLLMKSPVKHFYAQYLY